MSKISVVIIDYGSGNLRSAAKAFEKIAQIGGLDMQVIISDKASDLDAASHIVLPGQGAFGDCIGGLVKSGLIGVLEDNVLKRCKPFLGICVGMQLLADQGLEGGVHKGLGWIGGTVAPMKPKDQSLKIPHMGWNTLELTQGGKVHPALKSLPNGTHFYYVHSYVFDCDNTDHVLGASEYGGAVAGIIGRDNILGVQFHPEKSHDAGLQLIDDFVRWRP